MLKLLRLYRRSQRRPIATREEGTLIWHARLPIFDADTHIIEPPNRSERTSRPPTRPPRPSGLCRAAPAKADVRYRVGKRPDLTDASALAIASTAGRVVSRMASRKRHDVGRALAGAPSPDDRVSFDSQRRLKDMDIEGAT